MMIWEVLSWIGRFAWPWLKGLVPWGGPKTTMALTIGLLILVAVGGPVGAMWLHMRGSVRVCEETCDLRWKTKLADSERKHNETVDEAVEAGRSVPVTPRDRAQRLQLCRESPTCRENRR